MLRSQILDKLHQKHNDFNYQEIENLFEIFIKKVVTSLDEGSNVEIRGFGTISKKINKEKMVRNPKTNEKLFKKNSYKVHFKIGKSLHKILNTNVPE